MQTRGESTVGSGGTKCKVLRWDGALPGLESQGRTVRGAQSGLEEAEAGGWPRRPGKQPPYSRGQVVFR